VKALTIKQPWAGCIAHLDKRVENRSWRCPEKHLGTVVAIHSAALPEDSIFQVPDGEKWATLFAGDAEWDAWRFWQLGQRPRDAANWPPKLALGSIVGTARIAGCHWRGWEGECGDPSGYSAGVICSPWSMLNQWHWELTDVRPLVTPVPCKGALGLWTVPADAGAAIAAQLEDSHVDS